MRRYASRDDRSYAVEVIPGWLEWAERQDAAGAYMATWMAFNAIYVTEYNRPYATVKKKADGTKKFVNRYGHGCQMIDVRTASERGMIQHALEKLPAEFKKKLITLPSSRGDDTCLGFFAHRVPVWKAIEIKRDALGQPIQGVVNVRETVSNKYPRWVPVDLKALETFLNQHRTGADPDVPDRLIEQLGDVLYTVRNNLFHGCKGPEDSNDTKVLQNALKMLRTIVEFYIDWVDEPTTKTTTSESSQ